MKCWSRQIQRMVAKLKAIKSELHRRMHDRTAEVGAWLRKIVLGYYQYHAVPANTTQLRIFKLRVCRLWQSVLVRRSQRAQMRWEGLTPILNRGFLHPVYCIPTPMHASTPLILRKSRMRKRASTDLCGGRSVMIVPTATVIRLSSRHAWKSPDMPRTEAYPDLEMVAARPVAQVFGCLESWQIVGKSVFRGRSPQEAKVRIAAYLLI
jgi:hypothetical protein